MKSAATPTRRRFASASRTAKAADWLKDYLSEHARPWDDVTAAGKTEGFTEHTLRRARDMLKAAGIVNGTRGVTQAFVWYLVASGSSSPREEEPLIGLCADEVPRGPRCCRNEILIFL